MTLRLSARDVTYDIVSATSIRLPGPVVLLPQERLDAYADEALAVFDALLDNELTLTVTATVAASVSKASVGVKGSAAARSATAVT